jgi:sporulation protein YlmC with PRC-barrel domain
LNHHASKICPAGGTAGGVTGFSSAQFISRRNQMFAKFMTAGLVGSALLATVAFAQSPTTTADRANMASGALSSSSLQGSSWRASKIVGLSVYNDNNESLGTINDVLVDRSGNTKAVVLGVGGFLGVGEHLVAVPFEKIKFVDDPVAYTGSASNRPASSTTTGAANTSTSAGSSKSQWYPDHAVFNATKDELKAMPEFKYST